MKPRSGRASFLTARLGTAGIHARPDSMGMWFDSNEAGWLAGLPGEPLCVNCAPTSTHLMAACCRTAMIGAGYLYAAYWRSVPIDRFTVVIADKVKASKSILPPSAYLKSSRSCSKATAIITLNVLLLLLLLRVFFTSRL